MTEQIAALAMQGPTSCAVLKALGLAGVERLKPFEIGHFSLARAGRSPFRAPASPAIWATSCGWRPRRRRQIWDELMAAGRSRGIRAIGSQALNMARIEAGFLVPHIDFVSAEQTIRIGRDRSPLELGLAWLVDFEKGHFTGRRALLAERQRGPRRQLVGLGRGRQQAGPRCAAVRRGERQPPDRRPSPRPPGRRLASATSRLLWSMRRIFKIGTTVWAEIYLNRELVWERRMSKAQVVERPFFAPERRRVTPPGEF